MDSDSLRRLSASTDRLARAVEAVADCWADNTACLLDLVRRTPMRQAVSGQLLNLLEASLLSQRGIMTLPEHVKLLRGWIDREVRSGKGPPLSGGPDYPAMPA